MIRLLTLGEIVHYVVPTQFGNYVLPARVISMEGEGRVCLRIFTDPNGSEWMTSADYSVLKQPGTWHFRKGVDGNEES